MFWFSHCIRVSLLFSFLCVSYAPRSHADGTRISGAIPAQWCQDQKFVCTKSNVHNFWSVGLPPENSCLPSECSVSQWCGISTRCGDVSHCVGVTCGAAESKSRCVNAKDGSDFICICGPGYTGGGLGKLCKGLSSILLMDAMSLAPEYGWCRWSCRRECML